MLKKTPIYDQHLAMGARMIDFHGWELPVHYGSQLEEHHQVRRACGMFDVSHMTIIDLNGEKVRPFLRYLLANNVDRLRQPGKALYSCMLNEQGGVIDDLIVYFMTDTWFRMVINAATREHGLAWIRKQAQPFAVQIAERDALAMIAVQGPAARTKVHQVLGPRAAAAEPLASFNAAEVDGLFISRTGYTGEDGYEIMLPAVRAAEFWQALHAVGVAPIGLGARDTLRLEAGMNLSGTDMDETITPLEAGLGWTVAWEPQDRDFIGRAVLEAQRRNPPALRLVGLVLNEKGMLRNQQRVVAGNGEEGVITSGGFSPVLNRAIALARVPAQAGTTCKVDIRGKLLGATIIKPPFVRHGKPCVTEVVKGITV